MPLLLSVMVVALGFGLALLCVHPSVGPPMQTSMTAIALHARTVAHASTPGRCDIAACAKVTGLVTTVLHPKVKHFSVAH